MTLPRGPRPTRPERSVGASERVYRSLLRAYPRAHRDEYGDEMARCFRDLCRAELEDGGRVSLAALWARTLPELLSTALQERRTMRAKTAYRAAVDLALASAFILLLPLLAMLITDEVVWDLADFASAGTLLFGTGLTYELVARQGNIAYRFAVGVALAAGFILVWLNLAVGVIGSEDERANVMYVGVLAVGIIGALIARFRPRGMARALFATALAQGLVAVIALIAGMHQNSGSSVFEIVGLTGFFVALFGGSALLFRYAALERAGERLGWQTSRAVPRR